MQEKTRDQTIDEFLNHIRCMVEYWDKVPDKTSKEKLSGLAFSMLVLLDGGTALPGFMVIPCPHPDDKQFHIDEGEDYYPETPGEFPHDIAGELHELFYKNNH